MKLVIGIGNPGSRYQNTRHNIGFIILEEFCRRNNLEFQPSKSDYWFVESEIDAFHFFLIKPTTYVNNSGLVVKELVENYGVKTTDVLVICDDTNLPLGELRPRKTGSDGGHNGLKSIIYHLQSEEFMRLRVGIGNPNNDYDMADYVLESFSNEELEVLEEKFSLIFDLIKKFICGGSREMLNLYSKKGNSNSHTINNLNRN
ncbi:MAG: aminoacyl-tRNA hydrolase [Melioribacteraceae bacterium]|nr:aminoacyl-tRNA hydrolase [Melioribacteraceae bacterium]